MKNKQFPFDKADLKYSIFDNNNINGEIHAIIKVTDNCQNFDQQLEIICNCIKNFLQSSDTKNYSVVFARILLSDAANQAEIALQKIRQVVGNISISYVQQPPLDYTKISVLLLMRQGAKITKIDDYTTKIDANEFSHFYSATITSDIADTYAETNLQLSYIERLMNQNNLTIADNCVRTWFFVQNIDVNYKDVVKSRKENFDNNGLTIDTHYITSTGIAGRHANKNVTSILDAYCVGGLKKNQMHYLYASEFLNRTSDYGVTFERGTYIDYSDRRHILISGTASINNKGEIVAKGDIVAQTQRMIQNVFALLNEANSNKNDIAHIICYLRDVADYPIVSKIFNQQFSQIPYVITLAPVCRPGWLIEMECMAISNQKSDFGKF